VKFSLIILPSYKLECTQSQEVNFYQCDEKVVDILMRHPNNCLLYKYTSYMAIFSHSDAPLHLPTFHDESILRRSDSILFHIERNIQIPTNILMLHKY